MEHEEESNRYLIEELRKRVLYKGPQLNYFHEKDLDRVQQSDLYIWLFLKHKDKDIDKAQELMTECLKSRESFGINDLIERNIDRRLFEKAFLYPRNKDRNGNPLLIFHARLYKKEMYDVEEVKKLFAFGLEKMTCNNLGKKITLIFDMQESGLANMDLDLIKFIITCFQKYFPNLLEYLIVFETPWILTAAWKIVKTWLSTDGISKIKFVNKAEITQYVVQDQLLTCLGGNDDFVYSYPPQLFSGQKEVKEKNKLLDPFYKSDVFSSISMSVENGNIQAVKHNGEIDLSSIEHSFNDTQIKTEDRLRNRKRKEVFRNPKILTETAGPLITISPANELLFYSSVSNTSEILQVLTITNTVSSTVAYKIKTTSPENFRVRPSSGPIPPGGVVEVQIFLQPGHETRLSKDKFLILSTIVPEQEKNDLSSMWKNIPRSSIMEQRLRCRHELLCNQSNDSDHDSLNSAIKKLDGSQDPLIAIANQLMDFNDKVIVLQKELRLLGRDIRIMFRLILFLIIALILALITVVIYIWKYNPVK